MNDIDCQDHYEILEISPNASSEELERAYRIALSAYTAGSLASYSIFDDADASIIREKIEIAYDVLSDPESRIAYDESIGHVGEVKVAVPADEPASSDDGSAHTPPIGMATEGFDDLEAEVEEENEGFDGKRLRRARLRRGIDLDEIATVTKVNPNYLQCLEEERFAELPARVYVRGFVGAYARAVGLDAQRVTETYMAYFDEAGRAPSRGRLLGRR